MENQVPYEESHQVSCEVCGGPHQVNFSFALTKDKDGKWHEHPVCASCRGDIIKDVERENKELPPDKQRFVQFFGLQGSINEASKRNEETERRAKQQAEEARRRQSVIKRFSIPKTEPLHQKLSQIARLHKGSPTAGRA